VRYHPNVSAGLGAVGSADGTAFRVWAPKRTTVDIESPVLPEPAALQRDADGFFSGFFPAIKPGHLYRYRLDGSSAFPDPCSRYQPEGPHGPSMVTDPSAFNWTDASWNGIDLNGQVLYEMHIGAFTPEGTFDAAIRQLAELKRIGVTAVEIMPVNECPGRRNWGYDGVGLFAPYHVYGDPQALDRFVDAAHALGLGVILDVVYNHLGPDGNYLGFFSDHYFSKEHKTDWGEPLDFACRGAREFVVQNACYWIAEHHLDGLRLDATQTFFDDGPLHVLAEISQRTRRTAAPRKIILVAENEPQNRRCVAPVEAGGYGLDAMWNDDFHHSCRVALTGFREAYLTDYRGSASEMVALAKRGFLFQGQYYEWQKKRRGTPARRADASFIAYLQNHDQVANHISGARLHALADKERARALTALLLLGPHTPMLFMGQEFESTQPFFYFTDHHKALAPVVYEGRKHSLSEFPSYATPEMINKVPDPNAETTFLRCKLDFSERATNQHGYFFHQDLLAIRKDDAVMSQLSTCAIDGAVINSDAFALRFTGDEDDRLLVINLGEEFLYAPIPEPLLAPPAGRQWTLMWRSNDARYGGHKNISWQPDHWNLPARAALWFQTTDGTEPSR
jgi:maltooligosyltrehalose trehalohydrolase